MVEQKSENMMSRVVFALFLVLVSSLGVIKPGVFVWVRTLTPTDLLFPLLLLAWLVALVSRRMSFVWHPVYWSLIGYFLALALSAVYSQQPRLSFAKLAGELYLMLLPVIAVNVITNVERLRLTLYAWLAGAIIPILVGLVGILVGEQMVPFVRMILSGDPAANSWLHHQVKPHVFGNLPKGREPKRDRDMS